MHANDGNIRTILGSLQMFANLAPEHLSELAQASRIDSFERNQVIFRSGDAVRDLYYLLCGQVKLAVSSARGYEKIIDVVEAGRCFGAAELFCEQRCLTTAMALKTSQVLCIAGKDIRHFMALEPRVALRFLKLMAQHQVDMESELAARHFHSGSQRLLDYFISLCGPSRDPSGETQITLRTTKHVLASRFDMQPETLSRALRDLTQAGLIATHGKRIRLNNARIDRYHAHEAPAQGSLLAAGRRLPKPGGQPCASRTSATDAQGRDGFPRSYCDEINRSGRQRMLSQRMAKSWLMLEQRLLPRRARQVLGQSIELFDQQLLTLEKPSGSAASSSARAELAENWHPYKALLGAEPNRKNARTLYDMNEAVLEAAHRLTLGFEAADATPRGKLLNLAGRQRMLAQRMAKLFLFQHMGIEARKSRMELEKAAIEFSATLTRLSAATEGKPAIACELDSVAKHWNILESVTAARTHRNFNTSARKVFASSESLLQHMDLAVELYASLAD
jgi:CRP-like cAMP-binding protein